MQIKEKESFQQTRDEFFNKLDLAWSNRRDGISKKDKAIYGSKCAAIAKSAGLTQREGFKYNCPHGYKKHFELNGKYTVALDWLQLGIVLKDSITGAEHGEDFERGSYRFVCKPIGTTHYKYCYEIYKGNELQFILETTPRNTKAAEKNNGLLRVENSLLYADWHTEITQFIKGNVKEVIRLSRVDIALDGLNYIYDLLCDYTQKATDGYAVKLLGKSKVSGGEINRLTRVPSHFKIGSTKGLKQIAVYNKTKDIARTSKNYIKTFWGINGLHQDKTHYRFEVRLKSNYLKQLSGDILSAADLADDDISKHAYNPIAYLNALNSDAFKIDLARKSCESFFEWVYIDDKNSTRCTRVNLFPIQEHELTRAPLQYNGTAYKAKMQVHNTFMQIAKDIVGVDEGIAIIGKQLHVYELHDWYRNRFFDFSKKYHVDDLEVLETLLLVSCPMVKSGDRRVREIMTGIFYSKNAIQRKLHFSKLSQL